MEEDQENKKNESTEAPEPSKETTPQEPDQTEEIKVTVGEIAKKWGLYVGLVSIVYGLIQQFAGLAASNAANWLGSIILIGGIVLAHREFKSEGDGFMSFKQGFNIGAVVTIISSVISVVFSYIYIKFVDDSMITMIKDKQIESLESRGMSQEQIDQAMQFSSSFMTPEATMGIGLFFGILIGIVISLIIAAITKNEDPSLEM